LSALARAFFYAGARALLVSHWGVSSEATVSLITSAVDTISRDKKVGRAEALRRAMLAMVDKGKPHEAHPAYWRRSWWSVRVPQRNSEATAATALFIERRAAAVPRPWPARSGRSLSGR
jgi:hypothetical protein